MNTIIKARFLYCENKSELEGTRFIIETVSPFYIGRILKFKDSHDYLTSMGSQGFIFATVPGYRVIIQFNGSLLHGSKIQTSSPNLDQIKAVVNDMADFYFIEKIKPLSEWVQNKFRI